MPLLVQKQRNVIWTPMRENNQRSGSAKPQGSRRTVTGGVILLTKLFYDGRFAPELAVYCWATHNEMNGRFAPMRHNSLLAFICRRVRQYFKFQELQRPPASY